MKTDAFTERPFVDFYRSLDISPVKQDINDMSKHLARRDSLYRFLGIPPLAVHGARVIEFGPGSGFNALHTAKLRPASYTLVDGNRRGIEEMGELFDRYEVRDGIQIVESLIEEIAIDPSYDLVLAEGLVVMQHDPGAFARRIASFAAPGGIVVLTCSDAVSMMGEVGRRLIALRSAPPELPLADRLAILRKLFTPHLATLGGMSRSVDDWILDAVIQPVGHGKLFSIGDAISALGESFDMYGSSPRFLTDWRWYKQVTETDRGFNGLARQSYEQSILNLLDYRYVHAMHPAELGRALLGACQSAFKLLVQAERGSDVWLQIDRILSRIIDIVTPLQAQTAQSLASLKRYLSAADAGEDALNAFAPFFGRGMQYVSFIRHGWPLPARHGTA